MNTEAHKHHSRSHIEHFDGIYHGDPMDGTFAQVADCSVHLLALKRWKTSDDLPSLY